MKPAAFEYCQPDTVEEALALLHEFGQNASVLAGGLSLGAMLNMRLARPSAVVDIKRIAVLNEIFLSPEIRIGATVTQAQAMENAALMEAVPLLALALPFVGHFQTRNRGTLCGSVAHADPGVETRPVVVDSAGFLGHRADAALARTIADESATRVTPLHDYKASADYRRALVRAIGARVLTEAFECAG